MNFCGTFSCGSPAVQYIVPLSGPHPLPDRKLTTVYLAR